MYRDIKICAYIIKGHTDSICWDVEDDEVSLNFEFVSFESLDEYLKGNKEIEVNTIDLEMTGKEDLYQDIDVSRCNAELARAILADGIFVELQSGDKIDFNKMIGANNVINTKNLSISEVMDLLNNPELPKNCKFLDRYNGDTELSLEDMKKVYSYYDNLKLKTQDLSPAEIVFYVYDIVRSQVYNMEAEDEEETVSRDLLKTLDGDKIVCVGFANQMAAACSFLGVNVEVAHWRSITEGEAGHASIVVYLDDPKYNFKGIYFFDPTQDCKKGADDKEYVKKCMTAFVPYYFGINFMNKAGFEEDQGSSISSLSSSIKRYRKLSELEAPALVLNHEKELVLKRLNQVNRVLNNPVINLRKEEIDIEKVIAEASKYLEFKGLISKGSLMEILKTVRALEVQDEPDLFSNDPEDIKRLYQTTLTHAFLLRQEKRAQMLLRSILNID